MTNTTTAAGSRSFDVIAFDLDDTLLDTFGLLVPRAAREACAAMIDRGLNAGLEACLEERGRFIGANPRGNVYRHLVATFGARDGASPEAVAAAGFNAFHDRKVEADIQVFAGAREMLIRLRGPYRLFLVTSGHPGTQAQKVRNLGLESLFDGILYVNPANGERKRDAFQKILLETGARPERCLSVGNRVDTDIGDAKAVGWSTCWVRYGEYAHLEPSTPQEKADFEIRSVAELSQACAL